jgi:hypothetical protein
MGLQKGLGKWIRSLGLERLRGCGTRQPGNMTTRPTLGSLSRALPADVSAKGGGSGLQTEPCAGCICSGGGDLGGGGHDCPGRRPSVSRGTGVSWYPWSIG